MKRIIARYCAQVYTGKSKARQQHGGPINAFYMQESRTGFISRNNCQQSCIQLGPCRWIECISETWAKRFLQRALRRKKDGTYAKEALGSRNRGFMYSGDAERKKNGKRTLKCQYSVVFLMRESESEWDM